MKMLVTVYSDAVDEVVLKVFKVLATLKQEHPKGGIRTFVLQVEETI